MVTEQTACGCCEGTAAVTPQSTINRPGLSALSYRVGTHAGFLETMKARLSSHCLDGSREALSEAGKSDSAERRPLQALKTREGSDPSIAFMDAWATVADVLTFYQERIANEGYLRTATERRSVLEQASLLGYRLRAGVAASVWLALELDKDYTLKIKPNEIKAQSLPGPGETAQTFENVEAFEARETWNLLKPRTTRPQTKASIKKPSAVEGPRIYLKGISTNLKVNDPLLVDFGNKDVELFRVTEVQPDSKAEHTLVNLRTWSEPEQMTLDREAIAALLKDLQGAKEFKVNLDTEMSKRVLKNLNTLDLKLAANAPDKEIAEHIANVTVPGLKQESEVARKDDKYRNHRGWIDASVEKLGKTVEGASKVPAVEKADLKSRILKIGIDQEVVRNLTARGSIPPSSSLVLSRSFARSFEPRADTNIRLAGAFNSELIKKLPAVLASAAVSSKNPIQAFALRVKAGPFGQNAPKKILEINSQTGAIEATGEWPITEEEKILYLDGNYNQILPDSWVLVDTAAVPQDSILAKAKPAQRPLLMTTVKAVHSDLSRAEYGISGKTTRMELADAWLKIGSDAAKKEIPPEELVSAVVVGVDHRQDDDKDFLMIRNTAIYAGSEELELAEEPIEDALCGGAEDWIELDAVYSDLESGRWLIVSGERADIDDEAGESVGGVSAAELVMLSETIQTTAAADPGSGACNGEPYSEGSGAISLAGDQIHTFIRLAEDLEYRYERDTVKIYGNVVKATHGETRKEIVGSGAGSQSFQSFTLKQPPLTYVASSKPAGAESTLKAYVNDVRWHETDTLSDRGPNERIFATATDDDDNTTLIFGNGEHGLRLPTGAENIRAVYRNGIGKKGNVKSGQISQLMSKPLGLKGIINPMRASGGADSEGRDTARKNAPRAVTALDRLLSVSDYADFACAFAGIAKALAAKITDGRRQWIHLTIAGIEDIPIDEGSDLFRNLLKAMRENGDPYQPVFLQVRELMLMLIKANVAIEADYQWEIVAAAVRAKLLDVFSFERRELGQDVFLSEVIAAVQSVEGVAYADVDVLGGIPEKKSEGGGSRRMLTPEEISEIAAEQIASAGQPSCRLSVNRAGVEGGAMRPAQLAFLSPDVADTLIINQIEV